MVISRLKHLGKLLFRPDYRLRNYEVQKLKNMPRYTTTYTKLLGKEIELVDSASFLFMYKEIFEQKIYKFKAKTEKPIIIDGGANIGLSVLYFKQLYPESKIKAFEPDIKVFNTLEKNVINLELSNVEVIKKALWSSETTLEFMSEGADGGRVLNFDESEKERYEVKTVRLRQYLSQHVDFLKLDIEGAETEVLEDCQDLLVNVDNLFVEYHSFVNKPQTLPLLLSILSTKGFRIQLHAHMISPQPFEYRNIYCGMDMHLNIFAFRQADEIYQKD